MKKLIIVLLGITILSLTGCNSSGTRKKMETLEDSINQYAFALRWGRYEDAYNYHIDEQGNKAEMHLDRLEPIRVTGFHIIEKTVNAELTEAMVKGDLNYYHNEYGTLRKAPLEQTWWYREEDKKWYLKTPFPEFK